MSESNDPKVQPESPTTTSEVQPRPRPRGNLPVHVQASELAEWTGDGEIKVSPRQVRALQVLSNGFGVEDAADAAGVSRATVYRWLSRDPAVRAIFSRWKRLCFESAQSRLVALQNAAVDVLADEIETKHNPKFAAMILDKMGVMRPAPLGADTPAAAGKEIEVELGERNLNLGQRSEDVRWKLGHLPDSDRIEEKTAGTPSPPQPTSESAGESPGGE